MTFNFSQALLLPRTKLERAPAPRVDIEGLTERERVMARKLGLTSGFMFVALAAGLAVACGDDDDGPKGNTGGSGNEAGEGGGGGTKAGSSNGGSAGKGGSDAEAGAGGDPVAGAAGSSGEAGGGSGGEGGEPTYAPITQLSDVVYEQASDLRALRFSADGKLWAAGHIGINTNGSPAGEPDKQLVIARFTADGEPDETFGDEGFLEVNLVEREEDDTDPENVVVVNDGNEEALGIVELENGDIIVSGNKRDAAGKGMDAYLARFNADGEPVTSFGTDGVAIVTFGWAPADDASWTGTGAPTDNSWGIELDDKSEPGTDKVVVFGAGSAAKVATGTQRTDNDRYVARVLAETGEADPDFNGGKAFTYNTGGTYNDNGRRGQVLADGSILAGGYTNFTPGGNHVILIKLKADGTRDTAFGDIANDRGIIHSNPVRLDGGVAECYQVGVQSNGRIITTGYGSATAADTLSRYGYVSTKANDLVSFAYKADGTGLDTTWGNVGMFIAQSEEGVEDRYEDRGRDLAVLADDRLVYAGNFATDPAIFVTTPNGELDAANGVGYLFRYDTTTGDDPRLPINGTTTSHFFRVVVSPDGTRIAASTNQNVNGALLAVLKVGE